MKKILKIINFLEKERFGIVTGFSWVFFISSMRFLEEVILFDVKKELYYLFLSFSLAISFFFAAFLAGTFLITILSNEKPKKVLNLVLISWPLILIAPFIDRFLFNSFLPYRFLTLEKFWDCLPPKIFENLLSFKFKGLLIELFLFLFLATFYVWSKTKSILNTALMLFSLFYLEVLFLSFPILNLYYRLFPGLLNPSKNVPLDLKNYLRACSLHATLSIYFSLVAFVSFLALMYLHNKKITVAALKNTRLLRTSNFLIWGFVGSYFAFKNFNLDPIIFTSHLAYILLSLFFVWQFGVVINDIYDYRIDLITNRKRPLASGVITEKYYKDLAKIFAALTLFFSFHLNIKSFFFIFLFFLTIYFYSAPPFRFRKYLFHNVFIGLWSVFSFLSGYFVNIAVGTNQKINQILICIFLSLFLGTAIKDLKDFQGDKENGIKTVFTVFGFKKGKIISTLMLFGSFLTPSILFPKIQDIIFFLTMGILASLDFYKKENIERMFIYYFFLLFYCFLKNNGIWF